MKQRIICIIFSVIILSINCFGQSITWFRAYGGPEPEESWAIIQTPDNGYILVGKKAVIGLIAMRLNEYGETIWNRTYPGETGMKIIETSDGNYLILGRTIITKIDINGNVIWSKGPYDPNIKHWGVKETEQGSLLICGEKDFGNLYLPLLLKTDSYGNIIWFRTYSSNIGEGISFDVITSNNNMYLLTGHYSKIPFSQDEAPFYLATDTAGAVISFYGYDTLLYHSAKFINQMGDGSIVLGCNGVRLMKINSNGVIQWIKRYISPPEFANSIGWLRCYDGGFAITGFWDTTGNQNQICALLLKTDSNGTEKYRRAYLYSPNDNDVGVGISQTSDSGFVITGYRNNTNLQDIIVIKTDKLGNTTVIGLKPISSVVPLETHLSQNFPNPFNAITVIRFDISKRSKVKLTLYDALGRKSIELLNNSLNAGQYNLNFNAFYLASGVYFYNLKSEDFNQTRRMVILK